MKKILIINDKNDDLNQISTLLKDVIPDSLVIFGQPGITGIERANTESPEIVLMGLETGELDRYEACKLLRSNDNTKHIPILLMTDIQSDPKSYIKGLEAGADGFLQKPIDNAELSAQLNLLLRINTLEKEKAELKKQLQRAQKMEAIGTLAGGIVHEFNNILFPIIGYTEMCMFDVPEDSKTHENLASILKAADRAKDLIQQIQSFSMRGDDKRKLLKIQYVIKESLKLLRAALPATIKLDHEIDNACDPIAADPSEIQQVLMNLCTRAYLAMEEKGGILEVTLSAVDLDSGDLSPGIGLPHGSYLKLSIKDTGPGIERTETNHIPDPQFCLAGPNEDTGMNLSMVNEIVQSYKGNIHTFFEPDGGTTVHVYLPVVHAKTGQVPIISTETDILLGNETILLVDDEKDVLEMMHFMLERFGYQVVSTSNGMEALKIFQEKPDTFDLVITDQTMPQMTGTELIKELRLVRDDIPIILCTGFNEKIAEDNTKHLGIGALVGKPVRVVEIVGKIRCVLDRKS